VRQRSNVEYLSIFTSSSAHSELEGTFSPLHLTTKNNYDTSFSFSDSWVCSDTTRSWSYGYVAERTPHPTITIKTWTAELSNVQHSATPLVFPPPVPPPPPSLAHSRRYSSEMRDSAEVTPQDSPTHPSPHIGFPQRTVPKPKDNSIYIIGYSVTSRNISGSNGWWKITKMDKFGIKDGRIEFWALASKWYRSKSLFEVQVWYIER